MRQIWTKKRTGAVLLLILGSTLLFLTCNFSNIEGETSARSINSRIELTAKADTQGICLSLNNIPQHTKRVFIHYYTNYENENFSAYTDLKDDHLEQIKQAGKIILPVVQKGKTHSIAVVFNDGNNEQIGDWFYIDCTAINGISINSSGQLNLNEDKTSVSLNQEPVFSSDLTFDSNHYSFIISIINEKTDEYTMSTSISSQHYPDGLSPDGLKWTFEPYFNNTLKEESITSGIYPAYCRVHCNIVYDDILWYVEIAKTDEFDYSL